MTYHKIGGLHWLCLGRLRIMWCWSSRAAKHGVVPKAQLRTYTTAEHNMFMF